jgi:hypothetical protein
VLILLLAVTLSRHRHQTDHVTIADGQLLGRVVVEGGGGGPCLLPPLAVLRHDLQGLLLDHLSVLHDVGAQVKTGDGLLRSEELCSNAE